MRDNFKKIDNLEEWSNLLRQVHFKTFFHSFEWEKFLEQEFSWIEFERYQWKEELLISLARCRIFGKEKLSSHPLCEYGGPLPLKEDTDYEAFIQNFRERFGNKANIKFHPYLFLIGRGLTVPISIARSDPVQLRSTFWIENFSRKTPEDLWGGFRKTLRHEIEKVKNSEVEIKECLNIKELKEFYGLYLETMKRHRNIPLPFSAFRFFFESMLTESNSVNLSSRSRVFLSKKGNRVVGGSVFLFYPPFIHYFINASDIRFRDCNIGHLILWSVIQKYAGSEVDYIDLGGTRKGSSLETFKRGWGAKEFQIYEIGGPKQAKSEKSLLRNIWGMLPTSVASQLAPFMLWMKV